MIKNLEFIKEKLTERARRQSMDFVCFSFFELFPLFFFEYKFVNCVKV